MRDINFTWNEPMRAARVQVDQDRARQLGLSSEALATTLNATLSGYAITQLRDATYLVDIVARAQSAERLDLDSLRNLQIPVPGGRTVPLAQVASIDYAVE